MIEFFFWISVGIIFYAYFGYPLSLSLLGFFRHQEIKKAPFYPSVSLIITIYNEEKRIVEKLENTLQLEYPEEKLEIIVASDGSTDGTNKIVRDCGKDRVRLLDFKDRQGKENSQKAALEQARGEVVVFSDVATLLDSDGLKQIVFNFTDPRVGCVSSEDHLLGKDGQPGGEGLYVRYEMWLRRLESRVNSLVGLSGSFFAARREIFRDFSGEMQSDFRTVLACVKRGMRGISDPEAIGYYYDISRSGLEFDRKVRTVLRGLTVFFRHLEFLNVMRYGFFSYQYFCHKLLRWLVPVFLCLAFASNLLLWEASPIYGAMFAAQSLFYTLAVAAWIWPSISSRTLVKIPGYFLTVNASILVAWWRYMKGQRMVMWTPTER